MECLIHRFILKRERIGLDKNSGIDQTLQLLGQPEDGWKEDNILCYKDLEIGLSDGTIDTNIAYFGVYPGKNDPDKFTISGIGSEVFDAACFDMFDIMRLLLNNKINFRYDTEREQYTEQKCIVTEFGDELYFEEKRDQSYRLKVAFLNSL